MCDEETSLEQKEDDQSEKDGSQISLLDLPIEIFLHICSFLDAATLVHRLSLVCKQFYQILNDDSLWKERISQIWPNTIYPVLPPAEDDELFWKLSSVAIEKEVLLWKNENSMEKISLTDVQYSTIDGLLLMENGRICISGARDRSLVCWNLPTQENEQSATCIESAHAGWIWDLASIDCMVYSCSWDQTIKTWSLTPTGLIHFKTYEMNEPSALLCIASCPKTKLFATGSFCKAILLFDTRSGCNPIVKYRPHQRAVIRLAMNSNYILSASEDRTVSVWDHRAGKTMKTVTISKESFPMSISLQKDLVYVGDSNAKLHVLDPNREFELVKTYTTEHRKAITGVHFTPGCVITSSMDKTVRISSPTDPPQHITTLTCGYGEIASTDYLNGVLAVSGTEGIEIWRPRGRTWC